MKILQIHNVQLALGGADNVIARERTLLESHGHQVSQYFVSTADAMASKSRAALKALWNRTAYREVRKIIASDRPDVAHVHTPFPILSPAIFRATHGVGVPTVETLHSHRMVCVSAILQRDGKPCLSCLGHRFPWPAILHRCYHQSLAGSTIMASSLALHHALGTFRNHVDRYIALSPFGRDNLLRNGFPADKIVVKPNFVYSDLPPGDGKSGHVVYVGRMVPEKGVKTLLQAWKKLDNPPRLIMIGDGPLLDSLRQEAGQAPIEFPGWQTAEQITEWMRTAALVVFPSEIFEAGPLVILEAFSNGTPVLASDVGNFTDQVTPGKTGAHFRSGDVQGLANRLQELLANRSLLQDMRQHAYREFQERYSPEVSYRQLMAIYEQAMACHRSA